MLWSLVVSLILGSFVFTYFSVDHSRRDYESQRVELKKDFNDRVDKIDGKLDMLIKLHEELIRNVITNRSR